MSANPRSGVAASIAKLKQLRFTPAGWLLVGVAGAALLIVVSLYAITAWSGTRLGGDVTPDQQDAFSWRDGVLILANEGSGHEIRCTVTPIVGESREVVLFRQPHSSGAKRSYEELTAWFNQSDGAAAVTCDGPARAWTGSSASRYAFVQSAMFRYGGPAIVAIPLLVALALFRRRR